MDTFGPGIGIPIVAIYQGLRECSTPEVRPSIVLMAAGPFSNPMQPNVLTGAIVAQLCRNGFVVPHLLRELAESSTALRDERHA